MKHGAAQIEDGADLRPGVELELRPRVLGDAYCLNGERKVAPHPAAHLGKRRAHGFHHRRPAETFHGRSSYGSFQHFVDRWNIPKRRCIRGHDARPQ
jgi:hypothetical protein